MELKSPEYFFTDRELFSALLSQKKQVTNSVLIEIALNRGIILPLNEDRTRLVEYISSLPHCYYDIEYILDFLKSSGRSEKFKTTAIESKASLKDLDESLEILKTERTAFGEKYINQGSTSDSRIVEINYNDIDYSMTTMRQKKQKKISIEITPISDGFSIRNNSSERADEIIDALISKIESINDEQVVRKTIDLSNVISPADRTKFFTTLISDLSDFRLEDVCYINVDKRIAGENDSDEDNKDIEEDESNEEASQKMHYVVKRATIDGENLLASPEYQHLTSQGFFICDIIWQSVEYRKTDGKKIEFEAKLSDAPKGKGFEFTVRGAFNATKDGYTKTKRPLKDKKYYLDILDTASQNTYNKLFGS